MLEVQEVLAALRHHLQVGQQVQKLGEFVLYSEGERERENDISQAARRKTRKQRRTAYETVPIPNQLLQLRRTVLVRDEDPLVHRFQPCHMTGQT